MDLENKLDVEELKPFVDMFNNGIPILPFPRVEECLGMKVKQAEVEIREG